MNTIREKTCDEIEQMLKDQPRSMTAEELTLENINPPGFVIPTERMHELEVLQATRAEDTIFVDRELPPAHCSCGREHRQFEIRSQYKFSTNGAVMAALGISYQEASAYIIAQIEDFAPIEAIVRSPRAALSEAIKFGISLGIAASKASEEEQKRAQALSQRAKELIEIHVSSEMVERGVSLDASETKRVN